MYRIFLEDGTIVYDSGSPFKENQVVSPKLKLEDSAAGQLNFTIQKTNPAYDKYDKMVTEIFVMRDDTEIWRGRVLSDSKDFYNQKKVECEGVLAYFNDSIQPPNQYGEGVRDFLAHLINVHNSQMQERGDGRKIFALGSVTVEDKNDYILRYTNYETTLSCINDKLLNSLGGHIRTRRVDGVIYLDYLKDYPNTSSQVIDFGVNLLDYTQSEIMDTICTAIVPRGAQLSEKPEGFPDALNAYTTVESVNDGSIFVSNAEAVSNLGWICKTVDWEDVTEPKRLLTKAREYITDAQFNEVSLEITAMDLSILDPTIDTIDVLDKVRCISVPHGMDRYFPVTKIEMDLANPENSVYTFGTNYQRTLTSSTNKTAEAVAKRVTSKLVNISQITDIMNMKTSGYITFVDNTDENGTHVAELLISSTPDYKTADRVWRWNVNGLAYSDTGYYGNYRMAMTMDGAINSDFLQGGVIRGQTIVSTSRNAIDDNIPGIYIGTEGLDFCWEVFDEFARPNEVISHLRLDTNGCSLLVGNNKLMTIDPVGRVTGGLFGPNVKIDKAIIGSLICGDIQQPDGY